MVKKIKHTHTHTKSTNRFFLGYNFSFNASKFKRDEVKHRN